MDLPSALIADGVRTVPFDPIKSSTPMRNPFTRKKRETAPVDPHSIAEALAREQKRLDDELGHRMAMNALGEVGDPLKAAVEKAIPARVDLFGKLTKDPRSI